ncbi:hypothetical protein OIU84_006632 [Salix udensis]|uniref:Methyltransferase type 12 domain-containing protein n=1 Tax=Salix udensis TaxID=889485 RepID=A0AAD6P2L4_9ROSI|nr:hypothetical protein OIU84_006632 [Salix udensis]
MITTMVEVRSTRLIEKKEYQLRKRILNGLKIRFKLMAYICKTIFFVKGLIPRTRAQQLQDLIQFKGISHYEGPESENHTALPCPGELLVEEHHSNYGEPWAGGRDVFEFLAESSHLSPNSRVLEIGCGTLRVGLHFIRYLGPEHYHCLERDELSLMSAFRYELPSQGLLQKRPLIVRGEDMDFAKFGSQVVYDLIYASAVFLHMPGKLVWVGLERLVSKLKPYDGRIFSVA